MRVPITVPTLRVPAKVAPTRLMTPRVPTISQEKPLRTSDKGTQWKITIHNNLNIDTQQESHNFPRI